MGQGVQVASRRLERLIQIIAGRCVGFPLGKVGIEKPP